MPRYLDDIPVRIGPIRVIPCWGLGASDLVPLTAELSNGHKPRWKNDGGGYHMARPKGGCKHHPNIDCFDCPEQDCIVSENEI